MSAALHLTEVGPVERAAHRIGTALLRWSESRAARAGLPDRPTSCADRTTVRLAFEERQAREARERHWDALAAVAPRLR
ncbi:hypothetical protein ACTJKO_05870 [Curtobacterium sp. 22159]|uniref:hypothetical protein n=1 Tax=Curtobacterium sp. 22159 TaxID=3453882 RepID=UPI003F858BEB